MKNYVCYVYHRIYFLDVLPNTSNTHNHNCLLFPTYFSSLKVDLLGVTHMQFISTTSGLEKVKFYREIIFGLEKVKFKRKIIYGLVNINFQKK